MLLAFRVVGPQHRRMKCGRDMPDVSPDLFLPLAPSGKIGGALDVSNMKLVDDDLPRVLRAAERGSMELSALAMTNNYITEDGVKAYFCLLSASESFA